MKRFINAAALTGAFFSMAAQAQVALTEMTVAQAAREIRAGKLTSEDLVKALAAQIERKKSLNAFIEFDRERALVEARARDAEAAARKWRGPLHGVPIVVKDNIHVRGYANTAGTPALKGFRPKAHANVVVNLVRAGAIVIGKTNMHELAFGITSNNAEFGAARNAYDPKRIAGGSSGGTGSAVAARLAPAGLGTDTGGSVRIPAALNGIAGLRPTLGRYSQDGITPIAHTRDTAGPMARTVEDLAMLDAAITGAAANPKPMPLKGLRIGVEKGYFFRNIDAETQKLALAALDKLKAAGAQIVEVEMPGLAELNAKVSFPIALYEANLDLARYLKKYDLKLDVKAVADRIRSPDVKGVFAGSIVPGAPKPIPIEAYRAALKTRPALQKLYADTFAKYRIVALAFPTTPLPAAPIGDDATTKLNGKDVPTFPTFIQNTDPGSNAGIPGLTLPIGRTKAGLPVGLEFDAPAGSDRRLLALGLAAEQVFGRLPPP